MKPETLRTYASMLGKPQYNIVNGKKYLIPLGEVIEAAILALNEKADRLETA